MGSLTNGVLRDEDVDFDVFSVNGDEEGPPYRIDTSIDSLTIRLGDGNGDSLDPDSLTLTGEMRPYGQTDTVELTRQSEGIYAAEDWGYTQARTEYHLFSIDSDGGSAATAEIPLVNERDSLTAPIRGWRPRRDSEQPVTVNGDRYFCFQLTRQKDAEVEGWLLVDDGGRLVTDESTREKAALTATVATKMRSDHDAAYLRDLAETLRRTRQLAILAESALWFRDTAANMLGVVATKGAGKLKGQATEDLVREVAEEYARRFVEHLAEDRGFTANPVEVFEGAIRTVADIELGAQADNAERGADVAARYAVYDEWTYDDAETYWTAVSEALADGIFFLTLRTNMLPDADIASQLEDVALETVEGATPDAVSMLADLFLSGKFEYIHETIDETAILREYIASLTRTFQEHTETVHEAVQERQSGERLLEPSGGDTGDGNRRAEITVVDAPSGDFSAHEVVPTTVEVSNFTDTVAEFFLGYGASTVVDGQEVHFDNHGTTGHFVELHPDEVRETDVTWRVESDAPVDQEYGIGVAVWSDFPEAPTADRLDEERHAAVFSLVDEHGVEIRAIAVNGTVTSDAEVIANTETQFDLTVETDFESETTYPFELSVEGEVVTSRMETLDPDSHTTIPLSHEFEEPGRYTVSVGAEERTVTVVDGPQPELVAFEVTAAEEAADGQVTITVTADAAGTENDRQTIAVGFPDLAGIEEEVLHDIIAIKDQNLATDGEDMVAMPGEELSAAYGDDEIVAEYPLVEGWVTDHAPEDDELYLELTVTPAELEDDEFRIQTKTVAATEDWQVVEGDPADGTGDTVDQQGEDVYEKTVTLEEPSDPVDATGEWPTFQYDAGNTGYTPITGPTPPLTERWRIDGRGFSQPAVADGRIYAGKRDEGLYAFDSSDGSEIWVYDLPSYSFPPPTVVEDTVYFSDGMDLFAVDTDSGDEQWRFEPEGSNTQSAPTVVDNTVYFGDGHGNQIYALDAEDGSVQWQFEAANRTYQTPTVYDGRVFATVSYRIHALDGDDGSHQWEYKTDSYHNRAVVAAEGKIYVECCHTLGEHITALDPDTGTEQWRSEVEVRRIAADQDTLYGYGEHHGEKPGIYAISAEDGSVDWYSEFSGEGSLNPVITDTTVYLAHDGGHLSVIEKSNGEFQGEFEFETDLHKDSRPAVVDDTMYISGGSALYALTGS
ncbi:PQQ-binding-like beta-propeller repeat protein [Natrialbaceae archaeon GCM10025810]|uniref:outer membrane protein assembly factor BamB family protein n=1 Tax=Halovalidus salilacus TaxID=3075124 RepID=UPI003607868B